MSEALDKEFFDELTKDTEFKLADTGSLMHSRIKVKTPLAVLNCIYGGGLPLGIMSEISGEPQSGKSTFLYQCMANYQKQYPSGVSVIFDMEASMDNERLESLGVDTSRVLRLPSTTMEGAFSNMFKMLNKLEKALETHKDLSVFMVYDSISAGGTNKQWYEAHDKGHSAFGAGTMMEPQRIIKQNLANVLPYMENFPVFLGLINQVFTHVNSYGGASISSGGGMGLKHFCHSHISFSSPKDVWSGNFVIGTSSTMQLKKSKLSPKMINIPCEIDGTKGGKINEEDSFVKYLSDGSVGLITAGSWYKFGDYLKTKMFEKFPVLNSHQDLVNRLNSNIRKDDLYKLIREDKNLFNFLQISLIEFLDDIYPAQREINSEFQKELMDDCIFFKDPNENLTEKLSQFVEVPEESQEENPEEV